MMIKQRTTFGGLATWFEFGEDKLTFTFVGRKGTTSYQVRYPDIPLDWQEIDNSNESAVYLSMLAFVVFCFLMLVPLGQWLDRYFAVYMAVCVALGFLTAKTARRMFRVKASTFRTPLGQITVLKEENHDAIMQEISARRREMVRRLYGKVNFLNDPYREIDRFRFLRERGYVDEAEKEAAIAAIVSHFQLRPPPEPPAKSEGGILN